MNTEKLFDLVKASRLLPAAGIEYNTWAKNKMRGQDNRGHPLDFSEEEKQQLEKAFWDLAEGAGLRPARYMAFKKAAAARERKVAENEVFASVLNENAKSDGD